MWAFSLCLHDGGCELFLVGQVAAIFFFFKQKTAYEMRISDWSSDVCSSDLHSHLRPAWGGGLGHDLLLRPAALPFRPGAADRTARFATGADRPRLREFVGGRPARTAGRPRRHL